MVGCKDDPNGAVSLTTGSKFTCDEKYKNLCMHDWFTNACCKMCHKGESIQLDYKIVVVFLKTLYFTQPIPCFTK